MGFDQRGTAEFTVARGAGGQWHVFEQGFEQPLASFEAREDAVDYANDLAEQKEGSRVTLEDEASEDRGSRGADAAGTGRS